MRAFHVAVFLVALLAAATLEAAPVLWSSGPGANNHTYEAVLVPGGISWQDAEAAAVSRGGHLASITSADENAFVFALVSGNNAFWVLDTNSNGIGPWLGGRQVPGFGEPGGGWEWSSGDGFGFTNWESSEPNNIGGSEDRLGFFKSGGLIGPKWNDYSNSSVPLPRGYIVEIDPPQPERVVWNSGTGNNGHTYQAVHAPNGITWDAAEAYAVQRGGHLASINSAEENAFVFGLVSGLPEFWYFNVFNAGIGPWLGGVQPANSPEPGGNYQWSDGSVFAYTNWSGGEPNNSGNTENRIHFYGGGGTLIGPAWNDVTDHALVIGFIIEFDAPAPGVIPYQVWDLKTDWSDGANPNGVWTYREGANALPHVNSLEQGTGAWAVPQQAWAEAETTNNRLPNWWRSNGSETFVHDFQAGDIVVHSTDPANGVGNGNANVIWTSPIAGTVSISGGVWMGRDIGRGNQWHLYKNAALLTSGTISSGDPYNRANPFLFPAGSNGAAAVTGVTVAIGDVIRLEIVRTTTSGDFVGVNLTITSGSIDSTYKDTLFAASPTGNAVYQYKIDASAPPELKRTVTHGTLNVPAGLAATDSGKLFVVNRGGINTNNGTVGILLNAIDSPAFFESLTASPLNTPHGIALRGSEILVVESWANQVRRFQAAAGGGYSEVLPPITSGIGGTFARYVAVHPSNGEVFVSLHGTNEVRRFTGASYTPNGSVTGNNLSSPHGIAFSPWGEMFVTNFIGNSISRFILNGGGAAVPNGTISGNGLNQPVCSAFSPSGELFVSNNGTATISRWTFDPAGVAIANGNLVTPGIVGSLAFISSSAPPLPPPCVPGVTTSVSAGLIGWWKGDGDAGDSTGNHPGTLMNGASFVLDGRFGGAFRVGGNAPFDPNTPHIDVGHIPELNGATELTFTGWMRWSNYQAITNAYGVTIFGLPTRQTAPPPSGTTNVSYFGGLFAQHFTGLSGQSVSQAVAIFPTDPNSSNSGAESRFPPPALGEWFHLAGVWRGGDGQTELYYNGALVNRRYSSTGTSFRQGIGPGNGGTIGHIKASQSPATVTFANGPTDVDDVRLYRRALTAEEIQLIASGEDFNTCPLSGLPELSISQDSAANVLVSWPKRFTGWTLESTTDLQAPWLPFTGTVPQDADDFYVEFSLDVPRAFFRLSRTSSGF